MFPYLDIDSATHQVFGSRLPAGMEIVWSKSLNTTAGRTLLTRRGDAFAASIELSTKVVDSEDKLRNTLCHEMCHAAAWLVNHVAKPPHGAVFKGWAAIAMRAFPDLSIATCHTYAINFKFQFEVCHGGVTRQPIVFHVAEPSG